MPWYMTASGHDIGNDMQRFIGKEIISKFGKPELLITNGGKELNSEDTNVYITKNGVKPQ
ncbi:hypothetical protein DSO57_1012886 [Entomophthora muscae]|uniref:Uncharacterized protein n=1 Tax=Entomophthora muscae TaxID=34485 RepID=A0ACC2TT50_9FUNG|nr:hypothetical protein DSO57_1012886 [Entomophthora muscae]